ncbi:MAG: sigma-70 family RNA polymerase sigma factor [bacterium]
MEPTDLRDPALEVGNSEIRLDVEQAVSALPRRQRQVVTLHYLADLPVNEVAAVLGISPGSVKSCLHDARTTLRTTLEQR